MDGIYITTLDKKMQAKYVGFLGLFWNIGRLFSMSVIVYVGHRLCGQLLWRRADVFMGDRLVRGRRRDVGAGGLPFVLPAQGLREQVPGKF